MSWNRNYKLESDRKQLLCGYSFKASILPFLTSLHRLLRKVRRKRVRRLRDIKVNKGKRELEVVHGVEYNGRKSNL